MGIYANPQFKAILSSPVELGNKAVTVVILSMGIYANPQFKAVLSSPVELGN